MYIRLFTLGFRFAALLAACLFAASCEKAIDFRGDEQKPMVVVSADAEPDTTLAVRLTYSRFFLSGGRFKVIGNADVRLSANGTSYTGVFNDSAYVFPYTVSEGDTLTLSVHLQNGGDDTVVTSSTRVPYRPSVTIGESLGNTFRLTLNDRAGEHNYYRMRITLIDTNFWAYDIEGNLVDDNETVATRDTLVDSIQAMFSCSDAAVTTNMSSTVNIDGEDTFDQLLFTDELFDGQSHDIVIKCDDYIDYYEKRPKSANSTYIICVESLSRDRYMYELSRYKQDYGDMLMTEPVQVQCNIAGGIGIFGAKATRRLVLRNEKR